MDHGEQIIDTLGQEVDRIERNIKVSVDVISYSVLCSSWTFGLQIWFWNMKLIFYVHEEY